MARTLSLLSLGSCHAPLDSVKSPEVQASPRQLKGAESSGLDICRALDSSKTELTVSISSHCCQKM
jgi:hypothetical protein